MSCIEKTAPQQKSNPAMDLEFQGPDAHITSVLLYLFFEEMHKNPLLAATNLERSIKQHIIKKQGANHVRH